jgi:hypothetical protein
MRKFVTTSTLRSSAHEEVGHHLNSREFRPDLSRILDAMSRSISIEVGGGSYRATRFEEVLWKIANHEYWMVLPALPLASYR